MKNFVKTGLGLTRINRELADLKHRVSDLESRNEHDHNAGGNIHERPNGAHRAVIGGMWEEIGLLQFDFLVAQGLERNHRFLDVGCGSLRGGVHFIEYLESGRYHGIDSQQWLLDAGVAKELSETLRLSKSFRLECRDDFAFTVFGKEFDFALAQSVFTHLPWNSILRCLLNMAVVLAPGGAFYATYFDCPANHDLLDPIVHSPGGIMTTMDADPYHYRFSDFEALAAHSGLRVQRMEAWQHPRSQRMLRFTKS